MSKEQNVVNYYVLCNKLKNVIRTGWKDWNVQRERVESVAEHIFGTQMLAIAMKSEYQYNVDIMKVIFMLAIHELGETIIGDLTQFQITKKEKEKIEHDAVHKILSGLLDGEQLESLFLEFDAQETKEAIFAYQCDKLECDLQSKLYDEESCVDLTHQEGNDSANNELVKELLSDGKSWSDMWITYGQKKYNYDQNFMSVSNYVKDNNIFKINIGDNMELLDVYNSYGELTGKVIPRKTKYDGLGKDEHIAVAIIYIQNNKGEFLMQKTSVAKGSIYSSIGGHITHGEKPLETIIRETKEEIGLDISNEEVIDLGHICVDFPVRFMFYLKKDVNIKELVLDKKEVESVHYFNKEKLERIIENGMMHRGHLYVLEKVLEYIQNN